MDPVSAFKILISPRNRMAEMIPPRRLGQMGISVRILRGQGVGESFGMNAGIGIIRYLVWALEKTDVKKTQISGQG